MAAAAKPSSYSDIAFDNMMDKVPPTLAPRACRPAWLVRRLAAWLITRPSTLTHVHLPPSLPASPPSPAQQNTFTPKRKQPKPKPTPKKAGADEVVYMAGNADANAEGEGAHNPDMPVYAVSRSTWRGAVFSVGRDGACRTARGRVDTVAGDASSGRVRQGRATRQHTSTRHSHTCTNPLPNLWRGAWSMSPPGAGGQVSAGHHGRGRLHAGPRPPEHIVHGEGTRGWRAAPWYLRTADSAAAWVAACCCRVAALVLHERANERV